MNRIWILLALAVAVMLGSACGGATLVPDTDVVEPPGFTMVNGDAIADGGMMRSGTLEYEGTGELLSIFREYIEAMKDEGWSGASTMKFTGGKATATLQKDSRTCELQFTETLGNVRAVISITASK